MIIVIIFLFVLFIVFVATSVILFIFFYITTNLLFITDSVCSHQAALNLHDIGFIVFRVVKFTFDVRRMSMQQKLQPRRIIPPPAYNHYYDYLLTLPSTLPIVRNGFGSEEIVFSYGFFKGRAIANAFEVWWVLK